MSTKTVILTLAIIVVNIPVNGQRGFSVGSIPGVNINVALHERWDLNVKLESRQIFFHDKYGEMPSSGFESDLNDYSFIVSRRTSPVTSMGGGYLIRIRETKAFHRVIQQFTFLQIFNSFRLAHRISADQTFSDGLPSQYRFRYRTSFEIPLNGQSVDNRELYFRVNNEYLGSLADNTFDLEIRLAPSIGYIFTDANKVEAGIDYRPDTFIHGAIRHKLWFTVNWFIRLR